MPPHTTIEIAHTLKVRASILHLPVPPSISISPPTTPLLVKENEDVSLRCLASGNPQPKVSWRRKNNAPFSASTKTLDGRLKISAIGVGDSSIYECVANNGVKGFAVKEIEINVQSVPWVETDSSYVPVSPNANINLTCRYNGQPAPEAEWWYNSFKINKYDKRFENVVEYGVRRNNYTEAILQLKNLNEEDYGDYTCRISNGLGSAEKTIHLSARPGPPLLVVRDNLLSWTVRSAEPVTEYKILYRKVKEDAWNHEYIIRSSRDDQHGQLWEHKIDVTTFLPSGADFELQLSAKNALGYGSLAQDYVTVPVPVRQVHPKPDNQPGNGHSYGTITALLLSTFFLLF
ncbi:hypothetical protein L596_003575 [Steinernema carpocapsae]|uniref:Ig-like domain-containing protein n=1 Tax=Steinernema carpocapsae TaxID=34508 RepID=A0A4V6I830_STECR|nr:hypothetical protein L596_003575 [Steinernema carpocapsae]